MTGITFYCPNCRLHFVPKCVPCRDAPRTSCPQCRGIAQKVNTVEHPAATNDVGPDIPGGGAA